MATTRAFPGGPVAIEQTGDDAGFDFGLLLGVEVLLVNRLR